MLHSADTPDPVSSLNQHRAQVQLDLVSGSGVGGIFQRIMAALGDDGWYLSPMIRLFPPFQLIHIMNRVPHSIKPMRAWLG